MVAEAATVLAGLPGVAFLSALRRSNVHGALDMGLAPGILPGRVSLAAGRRWYESEWDARLPAEPGMDTEGMLAAAADGGLGALVLVGADPIADFPSAALARRGVEGAGFVVAIDTFLTASARHADVVLPAATYAERRGSFTNIEGRITWLGQKVTAPGVAWPDWMIAVELSARLGRGQRAVQPGGDLGRGGAGVAAARGREPVARSPPARAATASSCPSDRTPAVERPPRPLDPMADPGIGSAELHMVPPSSLYGAGGGRPFGPGGDITVPAAEVEGRRNAPDDTPEDPSAEGDVPGAEAGAESPETPPAPPSDGAPSGVPPIDGPPSDVLIGSAGGTETGAAGPAEPPTGLRPPAATAVTPAAPGASGSLRLVATRSLWDAGTIVAHAPHLAHLHPAPAVRVHPDELVRLGAGVGDVVQVTSAAGRLVLPVVADPAVPVGAAAIAVNLPGASATTLIDAGPGVTDLRIEVVAPDAVLAGEAVVGGREIGGSR